VTVRARQEHPGAVPAHEDHQEGEIMKTVIDGGLLITLEGCDGTGKTTQAQMLTDGLRVAGYSVLAAKEPGDTIVGRKIRELLLHSPGGSIDPGTEALLYAADRCQHVERVIRPAMKRGMIVVCDRYIDSSVAYQGYGRNLGPRRIRELNEWASGALEPDLVILLDMNAELARTRMTGKPDRIESEDPGFRKRVEHGFLACAQLDPDRYLIVDACRPADQIAGDIRSQVTALISTKGKQRKEAGYQEEQSS
jgi:dTMP kinase